MKSRMVELSSSLPAAAPPRPASSMSMAVAGTTALSLPSWLELRLLCLPSSRPSSASSSPLLGSLTTSSAAGGSSSSSSSSSSSALLSASSESVGAAAGRSSSSPSSSPSAGRCCRLSSGRALVNSGGVGGFQPSRTPWCDGTLCAPGNWLEGANDGLLPCGVASSPPGYGAGRAVLLLRPLVGLLPLPAAANWAATARTSDVAGLVVLLEVVIAVGCQALRDAV